MTGLSREGPVFSFGWQRFKTGETKGGKTGVRTPAPVPVGSPDKTVEKADSGTMLIGASTEDPLQPRSPNDYSALRVTVVPKLAKANQDIPAHKVKELSRSDMAESGNDAIKACEPLR